jgi:hypothetical protein
MIILSIFGIVILAIVILAILTGVVGLFMSADIVIAVLLVVCLIKYIVKKILRKEKS